MSNDSSKCKVKLNFSYADAVKNRLNSAVAQPPTFHQCPKVIADSGASAHYIKPGDARAILNNIEKDKNPTKVTFPDNTMERSTLTGHLKSDFCPTRDQEQKFSQSSNSFFIGQ